MEELQDESISISRSKYKIIKQILQNIQSQLDTLINVMSQESVEIGEDLITDIEDLKMSSAGLYSALGSEARARGELGEETGARIIEGVFNGEEMIAEDGHKYDVPPNYASKSKLVEGDILKLTIAKNGGFTFKQIGPVDRDRIVAALAVDQEGNYYATQGDDQWKLLPASVSYYKGEIGSEVIILVPKGSKSAWAAVENIMKQ